LGTRVGTKDLNSFINGALGEIAINNDELDIDEISKHAKICSILNDQVIAPTLG